MRHMRTLTAFVVMAVVSPGVVLAEGTRECDAEEPAKVVRGCTAVIGSKGLSEEARALARSKRAKAYQALGKHESALADINEAKIGRAHV